jgi:uncharacterized protein
MTGPAMEPTEAPVNDLQTVVPATTLNPLDWLALVLLIVGGINWGLVGIAGFDLVAALFGEGSGLSRAVYVLVGLAALYTLYLAYRIANSRRA